MNMIQMENVTKTYTLRRQKVVALDDATIEIPDGDFVSLVGPSGSGKSTALLMLGGMLTPTSGRVLIDGQSMYDLNANGRARLRKGKIGFVFQTFNLVTYLTALENVQIPLYLAGVKDKEQDERARALLDRVGLGGRLDHKPAELSVGQQQRVALARMLANDPVVILADEPTGNLDPETSDQIIGFFEEFNEEGRTIVMVTHDPRAADRARRRLKLSAGKIVDDQPGQPALQVA
jgi:putative ABC transport system ATP-binding protein